MVTSWHSRYPVQQAINFLTILQTHSCIPYRISYNTQCTIKSESKTGCIKNYVKFALSHMELTEIIKQANIRDLSLGKNTKPESRIWDSPPNNSFQVFLCGPKSFSVEKVCYCWAMVVHVYNPSTQKVQEEELQIWLAWLHSETVSKTKKKRKIYL
jgi:hypothetical protein